MAKPKTVPLKVTAFLTDGRIASPDGLIMLDSILYHAWFLKHYPEVYAGCAKDAFDGYIGLPLRMMSGNRWHASRGVYVELEQTLEHYNKRPDFFVPQLSAFLDQSSGQISDSVGVYRAYRNTNTVRIIKDGMVEFWCMGHADEIMNLLSYIPAVGKKPSMGYGGIREWRIEDADADYSITHPAYGLMRPTPVEEMKGLGGYPVLEYGVSPPYWKQKNAKLCYVPIN